MSIEWITTLATSGGSALVAAAATDAWQSSRDGLLTLFERSGHQYQDLDRWLDDDAAAIENTPMSERDDLRYTLASTWRERLANLLEDDQEARDGFQSWVRSVESALPSMNHDWMQQARISVARDLYHVHDRSSVKVVNRPS